MADSKRTRWAIGCLVTPLLLLIAAAAAVYFSIFSTVETKGSPDGRHSAKLMRVQGIDVNFLVKVDGHRVYHSPDFAPVSADFREQLIWTADSDAVVLEVGGQPIFGYHAVERRPLTDSELLEARYTEFDDLGFEGELPRDSGKD